MSLKESIKKELAEFQAWAQQVNLQAHLATSEAKPELRKVWREAEQNMAILQARLSDAGAEAELELGELIATVKDSWAKLKASRS